MLGFTRGRESHTFYYSTAAMSQKFGSKYDDADSSSSSSAGGKQTEDRALAAIIDVTAIRVDEGSGAGSGASTDLDAALRLEIDYSSDRELRGARWSVAFVVDIVSKRYIVELGSHDGVNVRVGANSFVFSLDRLDVTRVKSKHLLNNAGLLVATLVTRESEDVLGVNLVVQTARSKDGDRLVRHILNPLR